MVLVLVVVLGLRFELCWGAWCGACGVVWWEPGEGVSGFILVSYVFSLERAYFEFFCYLLIW